MAHDNHDLRIRVNARQPSAQELFSMIWFLKKVELSNALSILFVSLLSAVATILPGGFERCAHWPQKVDYPRR